MARHSVLPILAALSVSCGGRAGGAAAQDAGADADADSDSDTGGTHCVTDDEWDPAWAALEDEAVSLLNATREAGTDCGAGPVAPVGPLDPYESLRSAARTHALDMAENGFVSLRGSDGVAVVDRAVDCGYDGNGSRAADLATDAPTAQDALDRWLGTQTGCELVMDVRFEEVGVGYHPDGIWVVAYGQP